MRTEAKHEVDARIQRLEQLVNSMISTDSQSQSPVPTRQNGDQAGQANSDVQRPLAEIESGRIVSNDQQTVYVSGSHWASICYEVGELREYFMPQINH